MARQKDPVEVELQAAVKMTRTVIRARHSSAADKEINDAVPALENAYYAEIQRGRKPSSAAKAVLKELLA